MRVYALLLGILLTTGYGYAAQIAVSSLGAGRQPATEPATVVPATNSLDGVWYGGVLDPVTVESLSGGARVSASQGKVLSRPTVRCSEVHPTRFRAVSCTVRGERRAVRCHRPHESPTRRSTYVLPV